MISNRGSWLFCVCIYYIADILYVIAKFHKILTSSITSFI